MSEHEPVDHKDRPMRGETDVDAKKKRKGDNGVGYGHPPIDTRFKKGESGNPRGRKPGHANAKTTVARVMNEKVPVREGKKTRFISKFEAMIQTHTNKAMKGDARSFSHVLGHAARMGILAESAAETAIPTREEDDAIVNEFLRRKARPAESDRTNGPEER